MTIEVDDQFNEVERYELRESGMYRFSPTRREFVQVLGAGVVVAVSANPAISQVPNRGGKAAKRQDVRLSDRFHISESGVVTVLTSKVEVGQGSRTQITQAAAEELRIPVEQIQLVMADTEMCPDDGGTAGSRTTPDTVPRVRNAAAAARELLSEFAAKKLEVDRGAIQFTGGVFSSNTGKQLTLADIAKDSELSARMNVPPAGGSIQRVESWKVLGTSVPKVNGRDVVTGAARYPSDIVRPNMLYGRVLRPASYGATLTSIDLAPAQSMQGVTVVRDGNFVGCAASSSWEAKQGVEAISRTAVWGRPPHPASTELFTHLKNTAQSRPAEKSAGDRDTALANATKRVEVAYTVAYIQHAPMEPRAAVAEWQDGKLTVWTGSQQPARVQSELSQAFRLPADRVRVIVPDTGGGFGGKHSGEVAVEAARLAQAAGRPVSLRWTREEEFTWAYFRPAGLIEVRAGVDSTGRITVWDFVNYNSGGSALASPYRIPVNQSRFVATNSPLRQGSYRALASTANTFARESAMDELADLAGVDPLEFRLRHLDDGRLKNVLRAAADKFGWRERRAKTAAGKGVGIACGTEKGSFAAACAAVEVVGDRIHVLSICEAYECGAIQNPHNLRAQVEGAIIMGLGGALTEAIHFKEGKILNPTFSEYTVPRMADVPELDIELLDRRDLPSVGAGETPIIPVAPAIANAVFQATRIRSRSMPLNVSGQPKV